MTIEYQQGWRWIVWIGGVDDYYKNYERAKKHYDELLRYVQYKTVLIKITKSFSKPTEN